MAFTAKSLADGTLSNAKLTLYSVPAGTKVYVKYFSCVNTGATSQTVTVYANPAGTSRVIGRAVLQQNEQVRFIDKDETLTLGISGLVEGYSTNSAVVDYVITGVEEA